MGREIRDSDAITTASKYLEQANKELHIVKQNFLSHLDSLLNNYKGAEANAYGIMLKSSIEKIEDLRSTFEFFSKYMLGIVNHDINNIKNTISKLKQSYLKGMVTIDDSDKFIY